MSNTHPEQSPINQEYLDIYNQLAQMPLDTRVYLQFTLDSFTSRLEQGELIRNCDWQQRHKELMRQFGEYWNKQHINAPEGAAFGLPLQFPAFIPALFLPEDSIEHKFEHLISGIFAITLTNSISSYTRPELGLRDIINRMTVSSSYQKYNYEQTYTNQRVTKKELI